MSDSKLFHGEISFRVKMGITFTSKDKDAAQKYLETNAKRLVQLRFGATDVEIDFVTEVKEIEKE